MSSTRYAKDKSQFHQQRFASSPEFQRGLLAYSVARRVALLHHPADREMVWHLQLLSHSAGGLKAVAADILAKHTDQIGTATMRKIGNRPGQVYNGEQVRGVRREMPEGIAERFLLKGEYTFLEIICSSENLNPDPTRSAKLPAGYPAHEIFDFCQAEATVDALEKWLSELCLDPQSRTDCGPWYFAELASLLRAWLAAQIETLKASVVVTELGRLVCQTLEYTIETRDMTLIDGHARMGKTHSAQAWCGQHPGHARYVQVPCTNDDISFYRAIAKALGLSVNINLKAQQLRISVEETLQQGGLAVVFDEAHYLWPNRIDSRALPSRMNWIMTALVNHDVPVALITTPQFIKNQKAVEANTRWTSEQFIGRIGHYQKLPESLAENDLAKVAGFLLPEGDAKAIELLVCYAQSSAKYLAAIATAVTRAKYLAAKDGRAVATFKDVKTAIAGSVMPSDNALVSALAQSPSRRSGKAYVPLAVANEQTPATVTRPRTADFASPRLRAQTPDIGETVLTGNTH